MSGAESRPNRWPRLRRIGLLAALLGTLLAQGCAGGKPRGAPFEALAPPSETSTLVYVYRRDTLGGVGAAPLKVDGDELTKLRNGEYLALILEPGEHEVSASLMWLGLLARSWNQMKFNAQAGQTQYIRVWAAPTDLPPAPADATVPGRSDEKADIGLYIGLPEPSVATREIERTRRARLD